MKAVEGKIGRVFVLRLEDGDIIPECIEKFVEEKGITTGHVTMIGCIDECDIIVGPRKTEELPPRPMSVPIDGAHEVVATGIIAPTKDGKPVLHIHGALGRAGKTTTGCLRNGASVWVVGEVVIYEIVGVETVRLPDEKTGFTLLNVIEKP
ncbi:MAG: DNA-binding protein [Clostridia bacterium]|nr:DNA-binding protein [Clostridia bacterium]